MVQKQYDDFYLQVEPGKVTAVCLTTDSLNNLQKSSPKAEGPNFDFDKYAELLNPIRTEDLGSASSFESAHKSMGEYLYDFLLSGGISSFFHDCYDAAKNNNKGLRLRLNTADFRLSNVAWEFIFDNDMGRYLCTFDDLPFTRFVGDIDYLVQVLNRKEATDSSSAEKFIAKTLLLCANAYGDINVRSDKERDRITKELDSLKERKDAIIGIEYSSPAETTWEIAFKEMRVGYNIIHFYGHGIFDGDSVSLVFVDKNGNRDLVDPSRFNQLFNGDNGRNVGIVLLDACESAATSESKQYQSGMAQGLVNSKSLSNISSVIAMQFPVTVDAAGYIASSLYSEISVGSPIDVAVQRTRATLLNSAEFRGKRFFATPVLFLRRKDGFVFPNFTTIGKPDGSKSLYEAHAMLISGATSPEDFWKRKEKGGLYLILLELQSKSDIYKIDDDQKAQIASILASVPSLLNDIRMAGLSMTPEDQILALKVKVVKLMGAGVSLVYKIYKQSGTL